MEKKLTGNELATTLTIRQHYAGLAMQGLCASNCNISEMAKNCAEASVIYADELIKALNDNP